MAADTAFQTKTQRERLLCALTLREIEAQSSALRAAYRRLEDTISASGDTSPKTLILDWLKAELTRLNGKAANSDDTGSQLLDQAVSLCAMFKK